MSRSCRWTPPSGPYVSSVILCTKCGHIRERKWFADAPQKRSGKSSHCAPCSRKYHDWDRDGPYRPTLTYQCRTCGRDCRGYASDQCQLCRNRSKRQSMTGILPITSPRVCLRCGDEFVPIERNQQRYCSRDCARNPARPSTPKHLRLKVLRRDEWRCYLCDGAIPEWVDWPHQLSGTVDHVIPWKHGGKATLENLRAAHWACNRRKASSLLEAA